MDRFSEKSLLSLGDYYVYGLIDPRSKQIFYIGKGTKNRVFEHEKESLGNPDSEKLKLKTIADIKNAGFEVEKIIINSNLTEEEAFAAEASLINAFNYVGNAGLTKIVAGHLSAEALSVDEYERINGAAPLEEAQAEHRNQRNIGQNDQTDKSGDEVEIRSARFLAEQLALGFLGAFGQLAHPFFELGVEKDILAGRRSGRPAKTGVSDISQRVMLTRP